MRCTVHLFDRHAVLQKWAPDLTLAYTLVSIKVKVKVHVDLYSALDDK